MITHKMYCFNEQVLFRNSGNKPVTMPLDKLHAYRCSEIASEVYKEGRQIGYFFTIVPGDIEIFGICLGAMQLKDE